MLRIGYLLAHDELPFPIPTTASLSESPSLNPIVRSRSQDTFHLGNDGQSSDDISSSHSPTKEGDTLQNVDVIFDKPLPSLVTAVPSVVILPSAHPIVVYSALVLAQVMWSGFHVVGKFTFTYLSPFVLPSFQCFGAVILFYILGVNTEGRQFYVIPWSDHKMMMVLALCGTVIAQQFFNAGVALSSASIAGMMQPVIPILTTVTAIAIGSERGSCGKAAGIALAIGGSLLMVISETQQSDVDPSTIGTDESSSTSTSGSNPALGIILFLIQCTVTSAYIILQKPLFDRITVTTFTFWLFTYGLIGHLLVGVYFICIENWLELPWTVIPAILYTIVFATFGAFSCFVYATKHLPASIASLGICIQSIASPVLGAICLGETVTAMQAGGGLLIIAGIVCVVWFKSREANVIEQTQVKIVDLELDNVTDGEEDLDESPELSDNEESELAVDGDNHDETEDNKFEHQGISTIIGEGDQDKRLDVSTTS